MSDNKNFLDPKMISTLVLIAGFWMAWSYYMDIKYPHKDIPVQTATTETQQKPTGSSGALVESPAAPTAKMAEQEKGSTAVTENFSEYSSPEMSFQISNLGMGIKNIDIKKYRGREDQPIILGRVNSEQPFSTYTLAGNHAVEFKVTQVDANTFRGTAQAGGAEIVKTIKIHPETYSLDVEVEAKNLNEEFKGLVTYLSDLLVDQKKSGFLAPPIEKQEI